MHLCNKCEKLKKIITLSTFRGLTPSAACCGTGSCKLQQALGFLQVYFSAKVIHPEYLVELALSPPRDPAILPFLGGVFDTMLQLYSSVPSLSIETIKY